MWAPRRDETEHARAVPHHGVGATAALLVALAAGSTACGETSGRAGWWPVVLSTPDAGGSTTDPSAPRPDADDPTLDAGSPTPDAGGSTPDAGAADTRGTEGLPDVSVIPDAGATGQPDANPWPFDVIVPTYRDRNLPDVRPPLDPDAGEAGPPLDWPNCPQDVVMLEDGGWSTAPSDLANSAAGSVVAADYDDAGRVVPAADGSACATHGWTGHKEWDDCIRLNAGAIDQGIYGFPLCNWAVDAGKAERGLGKGRPLYEICQDLAICLAQTGCAVKTDPHACLCGDVPNTQCGATHNGQCWEQELTAMQVNPLDEAEVLTALMQDYVSSTKVYGPVNQVYIQGRISGCFVGADGGPP